MNTNNSKKEIAEWRSSFTKIFHELTNGAAQEKLAEKIGASRPTIAAWLNCTKYPDVAFLCKIANAYNVSVDYLLGRSKSREIEGATTAENLLKEIISLCKVLNLSATLDVAPSKGGYDVEGKEYFIIRTDNPIICQFIEDYQKIKPLLNDETYPDEIKTATENVTVGKYKGYSVEEISKNSFVRSGVKK